GPAGALPVDHPRFTAGPGGLRCVRARLAGGRRPARGTRPLDADRGGRARPRPAPGPRRPDAGRRAERRPAVPQPVLLHQLRLPGDGRRRPPEEERVSPVLWLVELPLLAVAGLFTGYLALVAAAALLAPRPAQRPGPARHRFAVVIPAHNEAR